MYIFRYLLQHNCNVAAVNNDGDLPYDICEDDAMEKLLLETMEAQGDWFSHHQLITPSGLIALWVEHPNTETCSIADV